MTINHTLLEEFRQAKTSNREIKETVSGLDLPRDFLGDENCNTQINDLGHSKKIGLAEIDAISAKTELRYNVHLKTEYALSRGLVSFQANKTRSVYRWYKFKEAFSANLVEYFLDRYRIRSGVLLDPFAGSGTALFASNSAGLSADGIELLPIGQQIISTKKLIDDGLSPEEMAARTVVYLCTLEKQQGPKRGYRTSDHERRISQGYLGDNEKLLAFKRKGRRESFLNSYVCIVMCSGKYQLHTQRRPISSLGS